MFFTKKIWLWAWCLRLKIEYDHIKLCLHQYIELTCEYQHDSNKALESARKPSAWTRLKALQLASTRLKALESASKYFQALKNEALSSDHKRFEALSSTLKRIDYIQFALYSKNKYWLHIGRKNCSCFKFNTNSQKENKRNMFMLEHSDHSIFIHIRLQICGKLYFLFVKTTEREMWARNHPSISNILQVHFLEISLVNKRWKFRIRI